MATGYTKIATVDVGAGGSSGIDFSSIPSTYTDLLLKVSVRDSTAISSQSGYQYSVKINNSSANITQKQVIAYQTGGTASYTNTQIYTIVNGASDTTATFAFADFYFPNYAGANYKTISVDAVAEGNTSNLTGTEMTGNLWSQTTAINQITIVPVGTFAQYSTATLYGIKNS